MAQRNSRTFLPSVGTSRGSFQSVITPKSTYVQPAKETSGLRGLAAALGVVGQIADRQKTLQDEQDKARGYAAGILDSAKNDPAKIKSKEMYPQESHAFMLAHKESVAKAWAFNTIASWKQEYETWEGKNSNNPNEFKGWLAGKMSDFKAALGNDPISLQGATPALMEFVHNQTAAHAQYTGKRILDDELKNTRLITRGLIENRNISNPSHPSYDPKGDATLAAIDTQIAIATRKGLNGTAVKNAVIKDLLDLADSTNDEDLFKLLVSADAKEILKLTPDQMKQAEDYYLNHRAERDAEAKAAAKEATAAKKEAENKFLGNYMVEYALGNFEKVPSPAEAQAFPKIYKEIMSARTSMRSAADYINPVTENNIVVEINRVIYSEDFKKKSKVEQLQVLNGLVANKQLSASTLLSLYRTVGADPKDPKIPFNNPTIKSFHSTTTKAVSSSLDQTNDMGQRIDGYGPIFEAEMASRINAMDLTGKSPSEIETVYKTEAKAALKQMLQNTPTLLTEVQASMQRELEGSDTLDGKVRAVSPIVREVYMEIESDRLAAEELAANLARARAEREAQAAAEAAARQAAAQAEADAALQAALDAEEARQAEARRQAEAAAAAEADRASQRAGQATSNMLQSQSNLNLGPSSAVPAVTAEAVDNTDEAEVNQLLGLFETAVDAQPPMTQTQMDALLNAQRNLGIGPQN